ncbi:MAG: hypothetical protein FK733_16505 [Asgard group archaeon]|nr:hypothetical protein [Asgard group archaeon]
MDYSNFKGWQEALYVFLDETYDSLIKNDIDWAIIGSVATYLQKCKITPKDVDIIVKDAKSVYFISELLKNFRDEKSIESFLEESDEEVWFSSKEKLVDESVDQFGFKWVFARFLIDNARVEIAHITAPIDSKILTEGIWEAGPKIWPHIKKIPYISADIPVVPLEIQLNTNFNRGLIERVDHIISIFKENNCNEELVKTALTKQNYQKFLDKIKK